MDKLWCFTHTHSQLLNWSVSSRNYRLKDKVTKWYSGVTLLKKSFSKCFTSKLIYSFLPFIYLLFFDDTSNTARWHMALSLLINVPLISTNGIVKIQTLKSKRPEYTCYVILERHLSPPDCISSLENVGNITYMFTLWWEFKTTTTYVPEALSIQWTVAIMYWNCYYSLILCKFLHHSKMTFCDDKI